MTESGLASRPRAASRMRLAVALPACLTAAWACSAETGVGPEGAEGPELVAISAGGDHTCALDRSGAAFCWGSNASGQLGIGVRDTLPRTSPVPVAGGPPFRAIAAGGAHTCALADDGAAYCWGDDGHGQLGSGSGGGDPSAVPRPVGGELRFRLLTAGGLHTCGLTVEGRAYCWGSNSLGELGTGSSDGSDAPVSVAGGPTFTHLDAGTHHTCGVTADGAVHCWGYDRFGQIGPGAPGETCGRLPCARSPVRVPLPPVEVLDAGGLHTCAVSVDGRTRCWGANLSGELGSGGSALEAIHRSPLAVDGAPVLESLALGEHHSCGLGAEGEAYCWGGGGHGQVGGGGRALAYPTATAVAGSLRFAVLSAGMFHTCGLARDGAAYCWGRNGSGQLGDGSTSGRDRPVAVVAPAVSRSYSAPDPWSVRSIESP